MGLDWKQWSRSDILYGIVAPVLVILLIVAISQLGRLFGGGFEGLSGVVIGIMMELQELVVIVAVPLMLGLVWNRWAGGASGFLLGSIYALYWADSYHSPMAGSIHGAGAVLLGYILSAMLIGYMAGALNKRSESFRRMLIAAVTAATIGGIVLFLIFQLSPANVVTGITGFLLTVFARMATGLIVPVVAKVFMWYGAAMNKKTNS
ncbi:MAG: hypothetical protein NWE99_04595 [Candidatus Bathyarchaeota archaeon]|nr:hypothetical protein [Candidatus Bathyarchaeota archaeon]